MPLSASRPCYGWADAAAVCLIQIVPHLQKHLFHVEEPELARVMLLERCSWRAAIFVELDRVLLRQEGVHVSHKAARDAGRQFYRFAGHIPKVGARS